MPVKLTDEKPSTPNDDNITQHKAYTVAYLILRNKLYNNPLHATSTLTKERPIIQVAVVRPDVVKVSTDFPSTVYALPTRMEQIGPYQITSE